MQKIFTGSKCKRGAPTWASWSRQRYKCANKFTSWSSSSNLVTRETLARLDASEGTYSYAMSDFARVTRSLPRPQAVILRRYGGDSAREPYCALQFEKLQQCMREIRRVELRHGDY